MPSKPTRLINQGFAQHNYVRPPRSHKLLYTNLPPQFSSACCGCSPMVLPGILQVPITPPPSFISTRTQPRAAPSHGGRLIPAHRPPPRDLPPLWKLLIDRLRAKIWKSVCWLFEVRSRPANESNRSYMPNMSTSGAMEIGRLILRQTAFKDARIQSETSAHRTNLPLSRRSKSAFNRSSLRSHSSQEFEPWLKWMIFDAILALVISQLLRHFKRLRPMFELLGMA